MPDSSSLIILNVRAGCQNRGRAARELKALMEKSCADCDLVVARGIRRVTAAARAAARSSYQTVIAAGGDGTLNAVAAELVGTDKRLGVIPVGTFNYFARELGLPLDMTAAFHACLDAETAAIPVAEVNGRIFLNNASIGLYPMILSVREETYRRWGRRQLVAYWSVLWTLLRIHVNMRLSITVDGETRTYRTPMVFVARNSFQLQQFEVPGIRCVQEDGFSVYVLPRTGKAGLLRLAWRTFTRKLNPTTDFEMFCATEMKVDSRRLLRVVAFDGERINMRAPLQFRMHPRMLNVAIPRRKEGHVAA